jgi:hypothetical protein
MMEEITFMQWLVTGGLQTWIELFVKNNDYIVMAIYFIPKYFAIVLGKPGENKIIDLVGLGWNTAKDKLKERKTKD